VTEVAADATPAPIKPTAAATSAVPAIASARRIIRPPWPIAEESGFQGSYGQVSGPVNTVMYFDS
jgi:hypothetical protein